MPNLHNLHDPLPRHKRKTLSNELPNGDSLFTLEARPEYDLKTWLELGTDEQVRVHGFPLIPAHCPVEVNEAWTI